MTSRTDREMLVLEAGRPTHVALAALAIPAMLVFGAAPGANAGARR